MRKNFTLISWFAMVAAITFLGFGCGKKNPAADAPMNQPSKAGDTTWQYETKIAEPISAVSSADNVTLGDLNSDSVSITVAGGAFDSEMQVSIRTPQSVPQFVGSEAEMFGSPIEISAGDGSPVRLNEAATLTIKIDPSVVPADTDPSFVQAVYYNGEEWQYIKPKQVDLAAGVITIDTYHFSLFGGTKIKDETKLLEQWTKSQALDNQLREGINKVSEHVASQIIDMTLDKMGIVDGSLKRTLLADLLKDDGYKEIYDAYNEPGGNIDVIGLNQKIAVLAGKKIAENVPESALQAGLANLTEGIDDVEAVSKAAGHVAAGQYRDAARIIGESIADKFLVVQAGKVAVEVINYQVESWKSSEMEAAYKAYKNGANGVLFGYNNVPGDFDTIWMQMRGVRRQLLIDAIREENAARRDAGVPKLTAAQEEVVRQNVYDSYKGQFEERVKQDETIEAEQKKLMALMSAFKEADFLGGGANGLSGLDKGYTYETKLDLLYRFANKMMRDTKRPGFLEAMGIRPDKKLLIGDLVEGARLYFSEPDGRKKYADYLREVFGISLYPELSEMAGTWNGSLTIADVKMPAAEAAASAGSDSGCDFNIDLTQMVGKAMPASLIIKLTSAHGGTLEFDGEGIDSKIIPFSYADGYIRANVVEDGVVGTVNLDATTGEEALGLDGTIVATFSGGAGKITVSIAMSKPVTAAPTEE